MAAPAWRVWAVARRSWPCGAVAAVGEETASWMVVAVAVAVAVAAKVVWGGGRDGGGCCAYAAGGCVCERRTGWGRVACAHICSLPVLPGTTGARIAHRGE